jgi:3-oxo-5-alpha-steroid 4-dehydrogenase 3 / polyprenol reductase
MGFEELIDSALQLIQNTPPSQWCEAYFLLLGTGCLALQAMPADIRDALYGYGARRTAGRNSSSPPSASPSAAAASSAPEAGKTAGGEGEKKEKERSRRGSLVDVLGAMGLLVEVPHAWFRHFYVALLLLLLFWAGQFVVGGAAMRQIAEWEVRLGRSEARGQSMDPVRVVIVWGMLMFQAGRRAWECYFVLKPSKAPMLAIHWAMTFVFYFALSIAFWTHASGKDAPSVHRRADFVRWPWLLNVC